MNPFWHKTLLKTCLKHLRKSGIFALEILAKIPIKWGLYRSNLKLAVRLIWQPDRLAVDRPVDRQRSKIWPLGKLGRPPGRPPRYREQSSLVRSTGRPTGPLCQQTCTGLCTSVDRPVDRNGLSAQFWVRKTCKHFSKNPFKSCKNLQK